MRIGWNSATGSYDVASWIPSVSTYSTGTATWGTATITTPESYDPGELCWNGTLGETTLNGGTTACNNSNMSYHIGNYYNWMAAIAVNDVGAYAIDEDADQSICPAGWMLPKSGTTLIGSGSFVYLVDRQGLTSGAYGNIQKSPAFFTYAGGWTGESYDVGSHGYYWSSVAGDNNDNRSYRLLFSVNSNTLSPQYYGQRYGGNNIRCIAR